MSGIVRWTIAAAIGGFIGAAAWAGITYATGYEIGWIAWGIGLLVGLAVRVSAGDATGVGPGTVAVLGAIAALLAGKYATVHFLFQSEIADQGAIFVSADDMQMEIAHAVVEELETDAKPLLWPDGQSIDTAETAADFPPEVWAEAQKRWNAVPPADQARQIAERQVMIADLTASLQGMMIDEGFKSSFGPADLLFSGLAIFTAFKLGSGMSAE